MDRPKVTPKDFFLWAGAMVALYGSVIAFIALLFEYINKTFPDPLEYYVDPYSGGIRFAMASLIVLVPVTILLMRFIRRDIARDAMKGELWVRRWALVLTVFIAGAAVVGDLITLINYFLGGDLTTRFILKVLVLLVVAGAVFFHFLADLRGYWSANQDRAKMAGLAAGAIVLLTIVSGFFILGSPAEVRLVRLDAQKVSDLQNIQWQIVNFWQQKERLPSSLEEAKDPFNGGVIPEDPQSGEAYTYEVTSKLSFKLCATFNKEGVGDPYMARPVIAKGGGIEGDTWQHGAGEVCFDRTIDPERYPPFSKQLLR
ncbi:hypothetical protein HY417_00535 [Candidatus Kaiserbacteria bacterium]|nr:hypothetical protein [Candidatus Kaiserbacteria bacterium]